jgi:SPP1 family phage portal protein
VVRIIKVKPNTTITNDLVTAIVKEFEDRYLPRLLKLEQYYQVENEILKRALPSEKPNNKIAHGFAKYISNMATGYFMGEGIRYDVEDSKFKDALDEVLDNNYTKDINFEIAKEMSKKGIAYELLYFNEKSEIKSKKFGAEDFIPVYSTSVGEFLEFAIRLWQEYDLISEQTTSYAEVYTKKEILLFKKDKEKFIEVEEERRGHNFSDVPVIVYWNNAERKGDYEDVITLIDAYDKSQSDTANDFEYFTDAYLVVVGAGGGLVTSEGEEDETKAVQTLKQERILFLDEHGQAQWLIKDVNDTAVENFKNRVYNDIFFLSQVPALTDESFASNLSGVAIKYKLIGLEQLAVIKENKFSAAQKKKIKLITSALNVKLNANFDADQVEFIFNRNMIQNDKEAAEIVGTLAGLVSRETLFGLLPFVDDPDEELGRVRKEQEEEEKLGTIDAEVIKDLESDTV